MQLVAQVMAGLLALVSPISLAVQYAQAVPPQPAQTAIVCHDAAWEEANLQPLTGARVQSKLVPFAQKLLQEARTAGANLGITSAYRSCAQQLALRTQACGIGTYNLYQKPSEQCNPPTEPPGESMHQEGLAIDFSCTGYSLFETSPCLTWLQNNGAKYHLYNHELEAWHWSTTGI